MRSGDPKRREERVKLVATYRNNLGVLTIGAGGIGPLFLGTVRPIWALFALIAGLALHGFGLAVLGLIVKDEKEDA